MISNLPFFITGLLIVIGIGLSFWIWQLRINSHLFRWPFMVGMVIIGSTCMFMSASAWLVGLVLVTGSFVMLFGTPRVAALRRHYARRRGRRV